MKQTHSRKSVLVLGVGNTLLQDDGVGIHVTALLRENNTQQANVAYVDGGTIGLSLLPGLEDADALIIVDAAELHAPPGTVRVFHGAEIARQLSSRKCSVHEVAISDLLSAAALRGTCPAELALVAIQPYCTDLGLEPTTAIKAAIPAACAAVNQLTRGYQDEA
jgi:hydrogenase maturation protease